MNAHSRPLSRRNRLRLAATAVLAPALLLAVPAATQAATAAHGARWPSSSVVALPSCPASTLCTFQNYGYGGTRWNFAYSSRPHGVWFYVGNAANDQISSFYNNRAWTSYFAKDCPAGSNWAATAGGGYVYNLNDGHHFWQDGSSANDSISAVALGTNTGVSYPAHGNPAHGGC